MPELPDVVSYLEALDRHVVGETLNDVRLVSPFLLRTVDPPLTEAVSRRVVGTRRMGKRLVLELEGEVFLVIHLMIAGRLRWREAGAKIPGKLGLAAFDFSSGTLLMTEASKKKRASLHVVRGEVALAPFDAGGLEPLEARLKPFREALTRENRTLKRALTDPRIFSGIGNAYSDEILHRARLSPLRLTSKLTAAEIQRLHKATGQTLVWWTDHLRAEVGDGFPEKVTAFRGKMAVHGKYKKPCPDCGELVQRIRYADRECNYCAKCQNESRLLADRSLSRLLKKDWPKRLEDLETLYHK